MKLKKLTESVEVNSPVTEALGVANLQMFLDGIEFEHIGTGEVVIKCTTEDEYRKAQRILFKQRIPVEATDGLYIYIDDKYIYPNMNEGWGKTSDEMMRGIDLAQFLLNDATLDEFDAILKSCGANDDDSDPDLGYFAGMSDEQIQTAYTKVQELIKKVIKNMSPTTIYTRFFGSSDSGRDVLDALDLRIDHHGKLVESTTKLLKDNKLSESFELDDSETVYRVTYRHNDNIFSAVLVKANSEEEALAIFRDRKPDKEIIGASIEYNPDDMIRRGMSLLESRELRSSTIKLLDYVDEGMIDARSCLQCVLEYMSEYDVADFCNMYYEDLFCDPETLNEGPLKKLLRKVQNKFDPQGAKARAMKDAGDSLKKDKAKAAVILAKDFLPAAKKYKFYLGGDVKKKPLTWDEWREKFSGDIDPSTDPKKYALWHNAIVTTESGILVRRGSEDVSGEQNFMVPGQNTKIGDHYFFKVPAATDDTPAEDTPAKETSDTADATTSTTDEKPATGSFSKLHKIIQLTGVEVKNSKGTVIKKPATLAKINPENMDKYTVTIQGKVYPFAEWYDMVRKNGLLERVIADDDTNRTLNEAPVIRLSDAELNNPDSVDLKGVIKRAQDEEDAATERARVAEIEAKLKEKATDAIADMRSRSGDPEKALEAGFQHLVPSQGKADSVAGEIIRAMMRLLYRDYNDGDMFFTGYGLSTCGSSAQYLYNMGFDQKIDSILENALHLADDDGMYTQELQSLTAEVVDYLLSNEDLFHEMNTVDSRDVDYDYIESEQPKYDYEIVASDDIRKLLDAGILTSWDCIRYIEEQLDYESTTRGYSIERPWSSSDTTFNVTELTYDGVQYLNDLFERDADAFWESLVEEYADELRDDEEDFEDEVDSDEE